MLTRTLLAAVFGFQLVACQQDASAPSPAVQVTVPTASAQEEPEQPRPDPKPAAASTAAVAVAELGKPAPDFALLDTTRKTYKLSELRGKTVVLEWFNPDCPFVRFAHGQGVLKDLAQREARSDLVWLSVNSAGPDKQGHGATRNQQALTDYAMKNPVLLDEEGKVGRAYGAAKTPHLFVIDPKGVLVYRGGVDNAPMGEVDPARPRPQGVPQGERVDYLQNALEDLRAGRPLRLTDTPPYGCSVKYAS